MVPVPAWNLAWITPTWRCFEECTTLFCVDSQSRRQRESMWCISNIMDFGKVKSVAKIYLEALALECKPIACRRIWHLLSKEKKQFSLATLHIKYETFVLSLTHKDFALVVNSGGTTCKYQLFYCPLILLPMGEEHARCAWHGENKGVGSLHIAVNGSVSIVIIVATCIVIVDKRHWIAGVVSIIAQTIWS